MPRWLLPLSIVLVLAGCRPKTSAEDLLLEQKDPACTLETLDGPLSGPVQAAIHLAGIGLGETRAVGPAFDYTDRLTRDGYLVRRWSSSLVMALAGIGVGALAAALLLALWTRRPEPRWGERLGHAIAREVLELRALGGSGDPLAKALVARLEEPLTIAQDKAKRLVGRTLPLQKRHDSTTAIAHRESLERELEGLLARIERIHLQILVWHEKQLKEEDEIVKAQVAAAIADLSSALAEAK